MIKHCKEELPLEACGLLSGNNKRCETLWKTKNIKQSKHSFEISQKEIDKVFGLIKEKGQKLTGIYHSHPTAAPYPSKEDILSVLYPEAAYIIISFEYNRPRIRTFRIINKKVFPINIKLYE
ncbi:Mov34/MPN/PAD-1 family protein [Alteribacillus sp. JSM 102045]|uniref:Mov34/MPN/PAD-1 family protein n=1 Tax=Alteribacillus sp. JSM 102045 TaxID=1562101 RepID=UPI0035C17963